MRVEAGVLVRHAAERFGGRTALSWPGGGQSFGEVNEAGNRVDRDSCLWVLTGGTGLACWPTTRPR